MKIKKFSNLNEEKWSIESLEAIKHNLEEFKNGDFNMLEPLEIMKERVKNIETTLFDLINYLIEKDL